MTLVDAHENKHFPMGMPSPVAFIKFMLEQKDLTRKDLETMIGSRARLSQVLSGKRNLTLSMIRKLYRGLDIAPEYLIGQFDAPLKTSKPRTTSRLEKAVQGKPLTRSRRRVAA